MNNFDVFLCPDLVNNNTAPTIKQNNTDFEFFYVLLGQNKITTMTTATAFIQYFCVNNINIYTNIKTLTLDNTLE